MSTVDLTLFGTISLGGLIKLLERRDPEQDVMFNFCGFVPTTVASYRGYYDHLALGYAPHGSGRIEPGAAVPTRQAPTAGSLLARLSAANGATYQGYKGGSYRMELETPLWVATPGECQGTTILGLDDCDYIAVIMTGYKS